MTEILEIEHQQLYDVGESAKIVTQHQIDNKLLYYKPCCKVHFDKKLKQMTCPTTPCPDSKHWAFHLSNKRMKIVFGGNRSSKTSTCLLELLLMACFKTHPYRKTKNPYPGKWRIYESDFGVLEKLMIPKVKEWIPMQALKHTGRNKDEAWEKSYDPRYHILELQGDGMIDFMSYDQDTSKSASVELDGIFADEEMPESTYTEAMSRLISRDGIFMLGVTPLYDLSWAMKFMETNDPQVDVFHFEIYDNPFISEKAIKEFESSIPDHEKEARIYGRFLELQGVVYKELRSDIHLLGEDWPKSGNPVIFALDPHPRKPSVMTWSYVNNKGDIVFFDELEISGTAQEIARAIRYKESNMPPVKLRLIDPAAKAQGSNIAFESDTLMEFEREGLSFTLADNSEAGYNVVHQYLIYNKEQPLSSLNRPQCYFSKRVSKTWYSMTHLLWDEWNSKKSLRDKKERIKDFGKDFADCVRYTLASRPSMRAFQNTSPVHMKMGVANGFYSDTNSELKRIRQEIHKNRKVA